MTNCGTNECNVETEIKRQMEIPGTPEEITYGHLWAEIELQKLLEERITDLQEVKQ
jgi:hypothetical protein